VTRTTSNPRKRAQGAITPGIGAGNAAGARPGTASRTLTRDVQRRTRMAGGDASRTATAAGTREAGMAATGDVVGAGNGPRFLRIFLGLSLALLLCGRAFAEPIPELIRTNLSNKESSKRISAALLLGDSGNMEGIPLLLSAFRDESEPGVRAAFADALHKLTLMDLGNDYRTWADWWKTEDSRHLRDPLIKAQRPEGLQSLVSDFMASMVIAMIVILVLIVLTLALIGGYKMKQIKELIRRAETAVLAAESIAARSDSMVKEIDTKKTEVAAFISSVKLEQESEIERFSDHMEDNVEHRMREVTMTLRQKAERELGQTLSELKQESLEAVTRLVQDHREKLFREFENREKKFFLDVEAHTLFIEASFHYVQGRHEESLRIYKRLLVLKPDHYVAWNNQGTILRALGRFEEAVESYDKGLALAADNPGLLYNKAATFAMLKKTPEMLALLERSVRLDPEYKDEALNDEAFRGYWQELAFKDIAEG